MKKKYVYPAMIGLLFCFSLILISCGDDSKNDTDGEVISFSVLEERDDSGYVLSGDYELLEEPILLQFDNDTSFSEFWERHKAGHSDKNMDIPESIDFENAMVIVLLDEVEMHSGYKIEIETLTDNGEEIIVSAKKTLTDGPECEHLQVLIHPFSIVQTARTDKGLVLSLEEVTEDCVVISSE